MIRQRHHLLRHFPIRLPFRPGVLLAYLLALLTSHVIATLVDLPAPSAGALAFLLCVVVQTVYGRQWWS